MPNLSNTVADRGKPKIIVSDDDLLRLTRIAEAASRHSPEIAETLLSELERAGVVSPEAMPDNVIRMGSTVEYRPDDGEPRRVLLVFPGEADIAMNRISILTPIGTALLGLSPGQSMEWTARDQRVHRLAILNVDNTALAEQQASA